MVQKPCWYGTACRYLLTWKNKRLILGWQISKFKYFFQFAASLPFFKMPTTDKLKVKMNFPLSYPDAIFNSIDVLKTPEKNAFKRNKTYKSVQYADLAEKWFYAQSCCQRLELMEHL